MASISVEGRAAWTYRRWCLFSASVVFLSILLPNLGLAVEAAETPAASGAWVSPAILLLLGFALGAVLAAAYVKRRAGKPIIYGLEERKIFSATLKIGGWIGAFGVFGILVVGIANYGMTSAGGGSTNLNSFLSLFGANLVAGGAAAAVGAVLGFIFGIPRTIDPGAAAEAEVAPIPRIFFASNTNLERISDWLTTLLIGATLVQINDIMDWINGLGTKFNGTITNATLVPILVVYFFALSFLGVYLITRLYLTTALTQTLGLMSGSFGVSQLAAVRAKLTNAARSVNPNDLLDAISYYQNSAIDDRQRANPELNSQLARVVAKYLQSGQATDTAELKDLLRVAVKHASIDQVHKAQIKTEFDSGVLKTGDTTFDAELTKLLG